MAELLQSKKRKIDSLIKNAKIELTKYRSDKDYERLLQGAEKLWVAFTLFLEVRSGQEIRSAEGQQTIAFKLGFDHEYDLFHYLHVFHYEGMIEANVVYNDIWRGIKVIGNLRKKI